MICKKKIKLIPGTDGEVDQILEQTVSIEMKDDRGIMADLEKSLTSLSSDNSIHSTDFEVHELWMRYQDTTRTDTISALDFEHLMSAMGYKIPEAIARQAAMERGLPGNSGDDDDDDLEGWDYQTLEDNYQKALAENERQEKHFIPGRQQEINDLYEKHGFTEQGKQVDVEIDNNKLIDPDE